MFRVHHHPMALIGLIVIALLVTISSAQAYELTVRVSDTTIGLHATGGWLTVFVTNPDDSVAAFTVSLQPNRPDLIQFDPITVTAGALISNFATIQTIPLDGNWLNVKVNAVAGGFGTSNAERPLFRIFFHTLAIPDTMTDRSAAIHISTFLDLFAFARPNGTLIGIAGDPPAIDPSLVSLTDGNVTVSQTCSLRNFSVIDINRDGLPVSLADEVALARYILTGDTIGNPVDLYSADLNGDCRVDLGDYLELDSLFKYGGNLCGGGSCPLPCACDHAPTFHCCYMHRGNINRDLGNVVDLSDLSTLILYLSGGTALDCVESANVNGIGIVDLGDLSYLVSYLTGGSVQSLPNCP